MRLYRSNLLFFAVVFGVIKKIFKIIFGTIFKVIKWLHLFPAVIIGIAGIIMFYTGVFTSVDYLFIYFLVLAFAILFAVAKIIESVFGLNKKKKKDDDEYRNKKDKKKDKDKAKEAEEQPEKRKLFKRR